VKAKQLIGIFLFILVILPLSGFLRQISGVLEPQNDNEARLNRLLPPEKIIDAVGVSEGKILAEIGASRENTFISVGLNRLLFETG